VRRILDRLFSLGDWWKSEDSGTNGARNGKADAFLPSLVCSTAVQRGESKMRWVELRIDVQDAWE
jgi:hypothetical protein